jgi:hypothetical protein
MSIPAYGNFDALNLPVWDKEMIQSGFEAVESVEGGWEFLRSYTPPADQGFMFSLPMGKRKEIDAALRTAIQDTVEDPMDVLCVFWNPLRRRAGMPTQSGF